MKTLTILSAILLVSSCAFHSGTLTSNTTNKPVVHKDIATGVASTNIVFNIGGLSKDALISEARKNMVRERPLEKDEQYNNIEVNIKNTFYIIGHKTKVTINADVIAPKDSINQASYSENYLKKINNPGSKSNLFSIGDSVFIHDSDYNAGKIVRFVGESMDKVEVSYTDSKNTARTKIISVNRIYISLKNHRGISRGDQTDYGIVIAFGNNHFLVRIYKGYIIEKYPKE